MQAIMAEQAARYQRDVLLCSTPGQAYRKYKAPFHGLPAGASQQPARLGWGSRCERLFQTLWQTLYALHHQQGVSGPPFRQHTTSCDRLQSIAKFAHVDWADQRIVQ
jgi:hypothetical protein